MARALHTVLRNIIQQIDVAINLITQGADLSSHEENRETALHLAAKIGNIRIIKLLIENGSDVNAVGPPGATPLHVAAGCTANTHILKLLIDAGANINVKDWYERTPLHYSVDSDIKNVDVCKLLVDNGADVNAKNDDNQTPLHLLVLTRYCYDENIFKLFVEAGADLSAKDNCGDTILHDVVSDSGYEDCNVLNFLLEAGLDVNALNAASQNPLNKCLREEHAEYPSVNTLKILLKAGINVNDDSYNRETSLTLMIKKLISEDTLLEDKISIQKSMKFFIEYCDINLVCKAGRNILDRVLDQYSVLRNKEYFYKIVLEHIAKRKALKLPINSRLLDTIKAHEDYRNYFTECIEELEKARVTKPDKCWISYLNLLLDDESRLVKYAGNKNLLKDFRKIVENFPIFRNEIQINMSKAIASRELFNSAAKGLSYNCPIFDPYHLVIRDVLNILSEEDWEKLSEKKRLR